MLRGNSGSGKTTVAKGLQELFGRGTMVLSQDMIRREVLKERDGIDPTPGTASDKADARVRKRKL